MTCNGILPYFSDLRTTSGMNRSNFFIALDFRASNYQKAFKAEG